MVTRSLAFLILFLACGVQIGAQSLGSCEPKRFAFYDSDLFYDDDDGVKELIERRNLAYAANLGNLDNKERLLALEELESI
ncbi:MAG: hypothetical protein KF685_06045, partial [Acidobacteria bacterium]|nr:hypothetical protein [Acidobacteriota bacterium]